MDALKRDWPLALQFIFQALLFFAVNRAVFTADQGMVLASLLAIGGTKGSHHLSRGAKAAALIAAVLLIGCGGPEKPACAPEALAKIQAAYVAEALNACQGFTYDDCPALPALREKYGKQREVWEACQ